MVADDELIDVRQLMDQLSVEDACATAERYFAQLPNWDYHLAKPFYAPEDVPDLLVSLAVVLQGLALFPGMSVLDFGAGSCWTSRWLSQMGFRVTAADVSASALVIGKELYRKYPLVGERPAPRFVPFDGHRLDLPDASIDRVLCFDAFHHVLNQEEILVEMARVLVDGGVAGFSEPGPEHSKTPKSQHEMRTYKVIENDIRVEEIWELARKAGFTNVRLSAFSTPSFEVSLAGFEDLLAGGPTAARFSEVSRQFMRDRRTFFLHKGRATDSSAQYRAGLRATLKVEPEAIAVRQGTRVKLTVTATNVGTSAWLPRSFGVGAVYLGINLFDDAGEIVQHSYHWERLTPGEGRFIGPGETVTMRTAIPAPRPGRYTVELDLVSDGISWFGLNGSPTVRIPLEVQPRRGRR